MRVNIDFTKRPLSTRALAREAGHERRERTQSGILLCELETVSPLCIQSVFREMKQSDTPFIPASSLRGMIRNMMEVMGAGCLRLVDYPPRQAPRALSKCQENATCLTCRLFGFTDKDLCWAGKVLFTDAKPADARSWRWEHVEAQRESHGAAPPADEWMIFGYQPFGLTVQARPHRGTTRCIGRGAKLIFRVDYLNLGAEELAVLLFALTLRHGEFRLCHKLGYAKAMGLGTCTIRLLNQQPPAIGAEIEPYLRDPVFAQIAAVRSMA